MSQKRAKAIRKEARNVVNKVIPIEKRSAIFWFKRMPFKQRLRIAWEIIKGPTNTKKKAVR